MTRPRPDLRTLGLVAGWTLALTIALACDAAESSRPELPIGDLDGPWQSIPMGVPRDVVAAALAACRVRPPEPRPAGGGGGPIVVPDQPVLIDARGMGRLHVLFARRDIAFDCGLGRAADGRWDAGVESSASHEGPIPPAGQARILDVSSVESNDDNGRRESRTLVVGRVGAGVPAVRLLLGNDTTVRATTGASWCLAWWPSDEQAFRIQELDASGQPLGPPHD
ncbi:MAG: hypothetical protein E6I26_03620 [Chloroflexi bacterium]|nr:MAG: hypothetical protein E6I26_03620 [Chloroflexota bacterium]